MNDLIRRSDALAVVLLGGSPVGMSNRIAALPAVTVGQPVAHAYIVDGECEQIEWGAEYCLPDDPALTMLYAHPAPAPAAIREAALREAAEEVFSMDWSDPFELHHNILALIQKGATE